VLTEADKQAVQLAIVRYGLSPGVVQEAYPALAAARARGQTLSLLDWLVQQRLLTLAQVEELRQALEQTCPDLHAGQLPAGLWSAKELLTQVPQLGGYRLLRKLGEGGMGTVYLAYSEAENQQVALKVLSETLAANPSYVERFYREARNGALLNHANIVRNLAVGQDPDTGLHYLVLEYVDGPSAHQLLDQLGRLPIPDAVHIALDMARALEHAHSRNIIHRDIKPDNILLSRSGLAKLADLGLAKRTDEASSLTATRQGFGTPYYMPYEQALNAKYADGRSDIYALGATLYHLLTGEVPFPGSSPLEILQKKEIGLFPPASSLNPDVPPALDQILNRMMARDPEQRYQTASELIIDLERCGLAPALPSFADPDLALADPVMRQRLAAQTAPTQLDLQAPPRPSEETTPETENIWYIRYRRDGRWCKARATTEQLLRRLEKGRLPPGLGIARQVQGPFRSPSAYELFRPALLKAQQAARTAPRTAPAPAERKPDLPRGWLFLLGGLAAVVLAFLGLILSHLLFGN
jgi:serine/threonine protein kinase